MTHLRTLSLLPALSLSATELLLEPSGGKAILIDTNLVTKRSSGALTPSDPPKVSAGDEDEITQVKLFKISHKLTMKRQTKVIHILESFLCKCMYLG